LQTAILLPDWSEHVTLFTNGVLTLSPEQLAELSARGVSVETTPVVALLGDAPALSGLRLEDGRIIPVDAVFTNPRIRMASPLAEQLGCEFDEGPPYGVSTLRAMPPVPFPPCSLESRLSDYVLTEMATAGRWSEERLSKVTRASSPAVNRCTADRVLSPRAAKKLIKWNRESQHLPADIVAGDEGTLFVPVYYRNGSPLRTSDRTVRRRLDRSGSARGPL
jgi:hypothetical protein